MYKLFFILLMIVNIGCSTITSYPEVTKEARDAFEKGEFNFSMQKYLEEGEIDEDQDSLNSLCYMFECGLVAHTAGDYKKSNKYFEMAYKRLEGFRREAKINAGDAAEGAGTALLNDKTQSYKGEFFEQALLHTFKALNFIFLGEIGKARVEMKRAELVQTAAEKAYKAQIKSSEKLVAENKDNEHYQQILAEANKQKSTKYAKDKSNIYQLGCTFYLSSLVYELLGEYNASYIDLKKLYKYNPGFSYGTKDLFYKARKAGFPRDVSRWQKKAGKVSKLTNDMGSVVVFYSCDRGPYKKEHSFLLPTVVGFQKVAWPVYVPGAEQAKHIGLKINKQNFTSEVLTDINSVAIRYHEKPERYVNMAIRLAIKIAIQIIAYYAADQALGFPFGLLASLFVSAITSATEQADERSWMTLPRNIQMLRAYVPSGEYKAELFLKGNSGSANVKKVKVVPGKITFIVARNIGPNLYWDIKQPKGRVMPKAKKKAKP